MKAETFFDCYNELEDLWKNFLAEKSLYRNTSALGMTAMRICYYTICHPECALKEIALSLNVSLGSASQIVQALNSNGLLISTSNTFDRRRISIKPSGELKDFFAALAPLTTEKLHK